MDPSTGRFMSVDPYEGDPQAPVSLHRYLYGNASPLTFKDPSGKFSIGEAMFTLVIASILITNVQCDFSDLVPPKFTLMDDRIYSGPNIGLRKNFELKISGANADKRFLIVQWIKGSISVNGVATAAPQYGGSNNFFFNNFTVDAPQGSVEYPHLKKNSNEITLIDGPGLPSTGLTTGDRIVVDLDFIVTVYSKKKIPNPTKTMFQSPGNPATMGYYEWDFHDTNTMP